MIIIVHKVSYVLYSINEALLHYRMTVTTTIHTHIHTHRGHRGHAPTLCEVKEGEEATKSEHKAEQETDRDGDVGHLLEGC